MSAWVPLDVVAALVARAEADECSISHAPAIRRAVDWTLWHRWGKLCDSRPIFGAGAKTVGGNMGKPSSKRSRHMSAWVPLDVVAALVARAEADECSISHAMMAAVRKGLATTAPDARPLGPLDGLTPGEIRRYQAVADYAGRSLEDIVRASLEGSIRAAQAAGRLLDIPAADG